MRAKRFTSFLFRAPPPPVDAPPAAIEETPPTQQPPDIRTVFLGGIFILALLTALYAAREIILPIVLAFVLKLVLQPVFRFFLKFRLPHTVAAMLIIATLLGCLIGLGTVLSGPATEWVEKITSGIPKIEERLGFLAKSYKETRKLMLHAEDLTHGDGPKVMPVEVQGNRLSDKIFTGTRAFASGLFTTSIMLFFLLVSGDTFLRRLVEILPRFRDKRQAVDISQQVEHDISVYLLTISTMNALVGVATALIMYFCGMDNPVLWGSLAFLLNYVPFIGPLLAAAIYLLVGLMAANTLGDAVLPVFLYMIIHILEGSIITPLLLAKRFTLNPVIVIFSLIFWYWMWGLPGAILAMPMLTITKIICDRVEKLKALGHFLEG